MWPFKCNHPFKFIAVEARSTEAKIDDDFMKVTHHLYCKRCQKKIDLSHVRTIGGVIKFLNRRTTESTKEPNAA